MIFGILSGITWAVSTIIIGLAMAMTPFVSTAEAIFFAPFVSTFLHDACCAIWALLFNASKGQLKEVGRAILTKSGLFIMLGAVLGGPLGMTGYMLSIRYMGASIAAVASAMYPAIGAVLACLFLKEKMKWYQWLCLGFTILGVFGLSYTPDLQVHNFWLGFLGAIIASFSWGIEGVILAKCLHDVSIKDDYALQIRQTTSALVFACILLPLIGAWPFTAGLFHKGWHLPTIAFAALFATSSYLFYYRAILKLGAAKTMPLNVSYCAWAMLFTALFIDPKVLTPTTFICTLVVLVCGVFAACDFKTLFKKPTN